MYLWLSSLAFAGPVPIYRAIADVGERHAMPLFFETHLTAPQLATFIDSPSPAGSVLAELNAAVDAFNAVSECDQYRVDHSSRWYSVRLTRWRVGADCVDYVSRYDQPMADPESIRISNRIEDWGYGGFTGSLSHPPDWEKLGVDLSQQPTPRELIEETMDDYPGDGWRLIAVADDPVLNLYLWRRTARDESRQKSPSVVAERVSVAIALLVLEDHLQHRNPPPAAVAELRVSLGKPGRRPDEPITYPEQALLQVLASSPLKSP